MNERTAQPRNHRQTLQQIGGRDLLSFAEFPIALPTDQLPDGCIQLEFSDDCRDPHTDKIIRRTLIVKGNTEFGLPTSTDDDVLFALIQLSKLRDNFTKRNLEFSCYEVLKILGWSDGGENYARLYRAIRLWKLIVLHYKRAWWDPKTKTWMSEMFNVIDNLTLPDDDEDSDKIKHANSSITWNDVLFQAFQDDSLKKIDIDLYYRLRNPIAKRIYRFLDKRFYVGEEWEFDLNTFAFEYVGLNRTYQGNVGKTKEKLQQGIARLEEFEIIEPLDKKKRYPKQGVGKYRVVFKQKARPLFLPPALSAPARTIQVEELPPLAKELVDRGVSPSTARDLVLGTPGEPIPSDREPVIRKQIEVYDWMKGSSAEWNKIKNPPGFLVGAIQNDYAPPRGFEAVAEKEARKAREQEAQRREQEQRRQKLAVNSWADQVKVMIEERLKSLSSKERAALEQKLIARDGVSEDVLNSTFRNSYINSMVRQHFFEVLTEEEILPPKPDADPKLFEDAGFTLDP